MKVRELREHLKNIDPKLEVVCYSEDENFLVEKRGFILFDILAVNIVDAEQLRLDDGTPYLKFDKGPAAVTIATMEIASDY